MSVAAVASAVELIADRHIVFLFVNSDSAAIDRRCQTCPAGTPKSEPGSVPGLGSGSGSVPGFAVLYLAGSDFEQIQLEHVPVAFGVSNPEVMRGQAGLLW